MLLDILKAPTNQKAWVRPIAFVLFNGFTIKPPVILPIRPEDLSRTEPMRAAVHQTMGRDVSGWVDSFGEGLPSISISGTTGWRANGLLFWKDGFSCFQDLNQLVAHDFPAAQQFAIDTGIDPGRVKLIFVDMLDEFAYPVIPLQFQLRRSKSRPLLFQYQIQMQATATQIEIPILGGLALGTILAGLSALLSAASTIKSALGSIFGAVSSSVGAPEVAAPISSMLTRSVEVFDALSSSLSSADRQEFVLSGSDARLAAGLAKSSVNVLRTLATTPLIPQSTVAELSRGAAQYNSVVCLFSNSLRDRQLYEDYSPLYGASNCSSTTGGRSVSKYSNENTFSSIDFSTTAAASKATSEALASISALSIMDPVFSRMSIPELSRHARLISDGVTPP